jgi:hypothetical protein
MSGARLSPPQLLISAIDELFAFLVEHTKSGSGRLDIRRVDDIGGAILGYAVACRLELPKATQGEHKHAYGPTAMPVIFTTGGANFMDDGTWAGNMRSLRAAACALVAIEESGADSGEPSQRIAGKPKKRAATQTRNRKSRVAELLLIFLSDDRRRANLNLTELASQLEVDKSSISRAFKHRKYGPMILKRYEEWGLPPPRRRGP